MDLNKMMLIGRLDEKPELRASSAGATVTNFNIATNESWIDKNGTKQERTDWHRVVVWGNLAKTCATHLLKGSLVYVEGKIQTRKWEDKDGQTKYTAEVIAHTVSFLKTKNEATHG